MISFAGLRGGGGGGGGGLVALLCRNTPQANDETSIGFLLEANIMLDTIK